MGLKYTKGHRNLQSPFFANYSKTFGMTISPSLQTRGKPTSCIAYNKSTNSFGA